MSEDRGDVVGRALFLATVLAVYPRIYFGFSFYDEAYYLALPVGFLAGHAPFVEERALPQLAALLTQPWVALWLGIMGSTDGLVLFARHVYFATAVAVALGVARFWREIVGERFAWLAGAIVVVYVPFCLFALSYNTFTLHGLWLGCAALGTAAVPANRPHRAAIGMGLGTLCLAIASFSYPPMFFVALPALALALVQLRSARGTEATKAGLRGMFIAGTLAAVILCGLLIALGLPGSFDELLAFSRAQAVQGGGLLKLQGMVRELGFQQNFLVLLASTLLLLLAPLSLRPVPRTATLGAVALGPAIALVALFYREFHSPYTVMPFVLTLLGCAAPIALAVARERFAEASRRGLISYTAVSVGAGFAIWWATSNGLRNAALGFAPAALVTLSCLALPPRDRDGDGDGEDRRAHGQGLLPITLALVSLTAFGVFDLWTHAYRERPPAELEVAMKSGPWRGIRTTATADAFVEALVGDLALVRAAAQGEREVADSIYFYDYFPAGYLLSDLRPRASTLWTFPLGRIMQGTLPLREAYVAGLREQAELPGWVVRMKCIPSTPPVALEYRASDPLPRFFADQGYTPRLERPCYRIESR